MANNYQFKTYKPKSSSSSSSSSDILNISGLKSIEDILNEVKTKKELLQKSQQYQTEANTLDQNIQEQAKPESSKGKRVLATGQDALGSIGVGLTSGLENIEDTTLNVQGAGLSLWDKIRAGFYDLIGQDQKANMIRINSGMLHGTLDIQDEQTDYGYAKVKEWRDEAIEDSYMGNIPRQAFEGVGQMLPAIALSIPTGGAGAMTTLGFQAFGGSSEQALEEGATPEQAFVYGALSTGVELATEKLVGGGFGKLTGVGGVLDKPISKVSRSVLGKLALEVIGEGIEEGLAEAIDPYLKNLTYSEGEKIDWKQVGESALVGGLTSLLMEGANTVIQKSTKADVTEIVQEHNNLNRAIEAEKIDGTLTQEKLLQYEDKMAELESLLQKKINSMKPSEKYKYLSKTFPDGTKITDYAIFKDFDGMSFIKKQPEISSGLEKMPTPTNTIDLENKPIVSEKNKEKTNDVAELLTVETKPTYESIQKLDNELELVKNKDGGYNVVTKNGDTLFNPFDNQEKAF